MLTPTVVLTHPAPTAHPTMSGNPVMVRAVNLAIWSRWISSAIRVSQLPQG